MSGEKAQKVRLAEELKQIEEEIFSVKKSDRYLELRRKTGIKLDETEKLDPDSETEAAMTSELMAMDSQMNAQYESFIDSLNEEEQVNFLEPQVSKIRNNVETLLKNIDGAPGDKKVKLVTDYSGSPIFNDQGEALLDTSDEEITVRELKTMLENIMTMSSQGLTFDTHGDLAKSNRLFSELSEGYSLDVSGL